MSPELKQGLLGKTDGMGGIIRDGMPPPEGCDTWEYRDLPWMDRPTWNFVLVETIRPERLRVIAFSQHGNRRRGQFWVSPEACDDLRALAARATH